MNKTTMTRAQLREAIALKRGWTHLKRIGGTLVGYGAGKGADGGLTYAVPDYLNSMDAALPLLRELPFAVLEYGFDDDTAIFNLMWTVEEGALTQAIVDVVGKEAEAVALAWWQWQTGEVVELVEES